MKPILAAALVAVIFEPPYTACSGLARRVREDAYPERAGSFRREEVLRGGQWEISTSYVDESAPGNRRIQVNLMSSADGEAKDYLRLATVKCSDESIAANRRTLVREHISRAANGTERGRLRLCRESGERGAYLEIATTDTMLLFWDENDDASVSGRLESLGKSIPASAQIVVETFGVQPE